MRARRAGRLLGLFGLGLAALVFPALAASPSSATSASTGACAAVGGGTVPSSGPSRATVVVDTGSGPVWSACISFSGTISGAKALTLAASVITDLDPYFDIYAGNGVAVCQLRHVGYRTSGCLTADPHGAYWQYFRNGSYASGGAGTSKVEDGSVEGWRWGGSGPWSRTAMAGTRAVAGVPATTTTSPPATTTTAVVTTTVPQGHVGPSGARDTTTSAPAGGGQATTTVIAGHIETPRRITAARQGAGTGSARSSGGGGSGASAGASSAGVASVAPPTSNAAGGSGPTTVLGVLGALAIIGGLGVAARRRRRPVPA